MTDRHPFRERVHLGSRPRVSSIEDDDDDGNNNTENNNKRETTGVSKRKILFRCLIVLNGETVLSTITITTVLAPIATINRYSG